MSSDQKNAKKTNPKRPKNEQKTNQNELKTKQNEPNFSPLAGMQD